MSGKWSCIGDQNCWDSRLSPQFEVFHLFVEDKTYATVYHAKKVSLLFEGYRASNSSSLSWPYSFPTVTNVTRGCTEAWKASHNTSAKPFEMSMNMKHTALSLVLFFLLLIYRF